MSASTIIEQQRGPYAISTDPARLDIAAIIDAISGMYWAQGRPPELIARSVRNSLCFGLYHTAAHIGLARVVTDYATFGYLADVYVLAAYRGQGLGKWLIETVTHHPDLVPVRRMLLATRDAHGLYAHYGFSVLQAPERWMERLAGQA